MAYSCAEFMPQYPVALNSMPVVQQPIEVNLSRFVHFVNYVKDGGIYIDNKMRDSADLNDLAPHLPIDPRTGQGVEGGCGDDKWIKLYDKNVFPIPDTPTEVARFDISKVSQINLAVDLTIQFGTTFHIYWEFSDDVGTDWYRDCVLDITAAMAWLVPIANYVELITTFVGLINIPNPGARKIKITLDGNTTNCETRCGFKMLRGWGSPQQVEV